MLSKYIAQETKKHFYDSSNYTKLNLGGTGPLFFFVLVGGSNGTKRSIGAVVVLYCYKETKELILIDRSMCFKKGQETI